MVLVSKWIEKRSLHKPWAKLYDNNFISVKIQMDTTKQDNEQIRCQYSTAANFALEYKITSFPTYLFFSPAGKLVDKHIGYLKDSDFVILTNNALNPEKQYYTVLENYKIGKKITHEWKPSIKSELPRRQRFGR